MVTPTIAAMPTADVIEDRFVEAILTVYRSAFTAPPWNESEDDVERFRARLLEDVVGPGFRLVAARHADELVGFATAWPTPSPFPSDRSYGKVMTELGADVVSRRLIGALVIDELAVRADRQGEGIASRLLDGVTAGGGAPAWLLTSPVATGAVAFYRRIGWDELTAADPGPSVHVFTSPVR